MNFYVLNFKYVEKMTRLMRCHSFLSKVVWKMCSLFYSPTAARSKNCVSCLFGYFCVFTLVLCLRVHLNALMQFWLFNCWHFLHCEEDCNVLFTFKFGLVETLQRLYSNFQQTIFLMKSRKINKLESCDI